MKYIVTQAVQLPTGTLVKLGKEKSARHAAQLAPVRGNQYECLEPVWVKAGESIDLDAPAKHLLACLEPVDKAEAKRAAAAEEARIAKQADEAAAAEEAARREAEEKMAAAEAARLEAEGPAAQPAA